MTSSTADREAILSEEGARRRRPLGALVPRRATIPTLLVLGAAFLPLALAPIRARYLGPEGRGEFAFFQAAVMVITAAAGGGIRHAYYGQSLRGDRRGGLWTARLWAPAILLAVIAAVPLAVAAFISLDPVVGAGVLVAALGAPLFALVQLEMADAQYHQRQFRVAGLTSVPACIEFLANVALLIVRALTLTSAIAVTLVSEFGRGIVAVAYHRVDAAGGPGVRRDPAASRALGRNALQYLPATLVPLVAANVDSIVYGALGHASELGVYSVAKLVPTFLLLAAGVSEGRFIAQAGRDGIVKASMLSTLPLLGLGLAASVAGGLVVEPLFGAPFASARPAFFVTALAGVGGALYVWVVAVCARRTLSRVSMWSSVVVLAVGSVGAAFIGLRPDPSPVVMGIPVLSGYTFGVVAVLLQLRALRSRRVASAGAPVVAGPDRQSPR